MMKSDEDIINELDNKNMFSQIERDVILGLMGLARTYERKRIREDVEKKSFETELPNEDGFVKVVQVDDIDIWKQ